MFNKNPFNFKQMIVKRVIETYEDFVTAMQAKKSEDAVDRNEGKNALGNFRRRNPVLFDKPKIRNYHPIHD